MDDYDRTESLDWERITDQIVADIGVPVDDTSIHSVTDRPICVVDLLGMGCNAEEDPGWFLKERLEGFIDKEDYIVMCNPDAPSTYSAIVKRCLGGITRGRTQHLQKCTNTVIDKLKTHYVLMVGHSYGGMMASLIVKALIRNGIDTSYLHVRTTGSIYIPKKVNVPGVDITHFLMLGDVATRCNGYSSHRKVLPSDADDKTRYTDDNYIFWAKHSDSDKAATLKTPWAQLRWNIHMDEEYFTDQIDWIFMRMIDIQQATNQSIGGALKKSTHGCTVTLMVVTLLMSVLGSTR